VRIDKVRVVVAPWFFKLPGFTRFYGYALVRTILLRKAEATDNLITHELCHVWQMQHRPVHMMSTWFRTSYKENPYEREAHEADHSTR
jgi:hypothetical protein